MEYRGCNVGVAKLKERECWRLMGWGARDENGTWHDDDFEKAAEKVSRTQLYKQSGNGIITNCIAEIVKKMFPDGLDKPLKLIELFGGIGCQIKGIKMAGIPVESHFYCDFDKYATMSYNAINGTEYKPQDIKNIRGSDLNIRNIDEEVYLLTYSFPCTDLSCAGKMAGMSKNAEVQTRSGLLWEVERILTEIAESGGELPNFLLLENVPQLHGKKNIADFEQWIAFLESIGYHSKWTDINGLDVGIPQNRKRCFMVSSLKPLDDFEWPEKKELTTCMADFLDDERDEKYFVNNERSEKLIMDLIERGELDQYIDELEKKQSTQKEIRIGNLYGGTGGNFAGMVYDKNGVCPALLTMSGGVDSRTSLLVPAALDRHYGNKKIMKLKDAKLKNINAMWAGTITARYFKGVAADSDNVVIVIGRNNE